METSKRAFIQRYLDNLENAITACNKAAPDELATVQDALADVVVEICNVFSKQLPELGQSVLLNNNSALRDANIVTGILELYLLDSCPNAEQQQSTEAGEPLVFISHRSTDKKYGDALANFISALGVKRRQLIYSSHPLYKIPLGENIYHYLRKHINSHINIEKGRIVALRVTIRPFS